MISWSFSLVIASNDGYRFGSRSNRLRPNPITTADGWRHRWSDPAAAACRIAAMRGNPRTSSPSCRSEPWTMLQRPATRPMRPVPERRGRGICCNPPRAAQDRSFRTLRFRTMMNVQSRRFSAASRAATREDFAAISRAGMPKSPDFFSGKLTMLQGKLILQHDNETLLQRLPISCNVWLRCCKTPSHCSNSSLQCSK